MNGNALKLRRIVEKHRIIGLDTAPFIYYIEDVAPYADLLDPVFILLENNVLRAVTSSVTFAEILAKPHADKNFSSRRRNQIHAQVFLFAFHSAD